MKRIFSFAALTTILSVGPMIRGAQSPPALSERTLRLIHNWQEEAWKFVNSDRMPLSREEYRH
jgi:hypothetical protein